MLEIVFNNYLLWINILIPFGIAFYMLITHSEYSIKEFFAQVTLTAVILIVMFSVAYTSQDIYTSSYNSTDVDKFVYEEEWTELVHYTDTVCSGSGKFRTCRSIPRTRIDHHPDNYFLSHSYGSESINKLDWMKAKTEFSQKTVDTGHSGQISFGDGRTYESIPNKVIPIVVSESGINYVYASKTNIIKAKNFKDLEKRYAKELVDYPNIETSSYGNPTINRVLNGKLVDPKLVEVCNTQLSFYASTRGKVKEVNPLIYFTSASDREIVEVIKGHYKDAHKNDAVLVVSVTNGKLNWVDSFGFTKSAEFFVANRNIKTMDGLMCLQFTDNIAKYWKRTPMEEYKYLISDIDVPVQFEIFVVLLNALGSFFLFRWMLKNEL